MVNYLKTMILGCFLACAVVGREMILSPQETILAGETTTLWGVFTGVRWHDESLSRQWEEQDGDLPVLQEGEICSYVWEYDCGMGVTLDDDWAQGLVRPLADSWHLFDTQCFKIDNGQAEGLVTVRLRYWDETGKEWIAKL